MKNWILFILILLLSQFKLAKATHIVGGEIYYNHLGGNTYEVVLIVYRDCLLGQAPFDAPANISIYGDNNVLYRKLELTYKDVSKLPSDIADSCFFVPSGVCVERGFYSTIVSLPKNNTGYTLTWQRCCRNNSIKNLNNPGDWGSTITTHVNARSLADTNSSPVFIKRPPLAICLGSDFKFDYSAKDADGDSLVYFLCEVLHGGGKDVSNPGGPNGPKPDVPTPPPYASVGWRTGFTALNPIDATVPFTINPVTGEFSGTPNQLGQYVFAICVNEYRDSVLLGSTRREYQVNVKACVSATQAGVAAPPKCTGLNVNFTNTSRRSSSFSWDFGVSGTQSDVSQAKDPKFTFPDSGRYKVRLIANPGWKCADTTYQWVTVYHKVEADVLPFKGKCISDPVFNFQAGGAFQPYTTINWDFGSAANPKTSTDKNPTGITYPDTGRYTITLEMEHKGCSSKKSFQAIVYPNLEPEFYIRGAKGCTPLQVQLEDRSKAWTEVKRIWTVDNRTYGDSIQRLTITEPGEYVLSHQAYTLGGCQDTSKKQYKILNVLQGPTAGFSVSEKKVSIFNPTIYVNDDSYNRNSCKLFFGDERTSLNCTDEHQFKKPGKFKVSQIVTNLSGCSDTASVEIEVDNEFAFFIPSSFTPNGDGLNEIFRPVIVGAKSVEFTIYDRWGHVIFYTEKLGEGWDGKFNNGESEASIGTYVYKVRVKDFLDEYHFYSDNVYLAR